MRQLAERIRTENLLVHFTEAQWRSLAAKKSLTWRKFCDCCNIKNNAIRSYSESDIKQLLMETSSAIQDDYFYNNTTYKLKNMPFEVKVGSTNRAVYIQVREIEAKKSSGLTNRENEPLTQRRMF